MLVRLLIANTTMGAKWHPSIIREVRRSNQKISTN